VSRIDIDVHATQNHHFRVRALWESDAQEVVPQIEVAINPHVGLAESHKGHGIQDPQGGNTLQVQAIIPHQQTEESVRWHLEPSLIECHKSHHVSLHWRGGCEVLRHMTGSKLCYRHEPQAHEVLTWHCGANSQTDCQLIVQPSGLLKHTWIGSVCTPHHLLTN
jgi:hypothetical protein